MKYVLLEVISPGVMSQQQQEAVYQDPLSSVFQRLPHPLLPLPKGQWSLGTGDGFAESAAKESIEGAGINFECALAATGVLRHQELLRQGSGISPG